MADARGEKTKQAIKIQYVLCQEKRGKKKEDSSIPQRWREKILP